MDSDTRELIEVVAKVRLGEEYEVMENGERRYDMCKAFMDMKLEGVEEGIEQGIEQGKIMRLIEIICIKLRKNKTAAAIANELEEELLTINNIIRIQHEVGSYDVRQIYEAMQKEKE